MRKLSAWALGAIALAASSLAEAKPISAELQAQLLSNLARGDLLYAYDQSAWHITDAMQAAVPQDHFKDLHGYVVVPDGDLFRTVFYGGESGHHNIVYAATWDGKTAVRPELHLVGARPTVTPAEEALIRARETVTAPEVIGTLGFCNDASPNIAMIPGKTANDPIAVYVMTPQTETDVWPLGGHSRVDVKDGKVVAKRAFTKACINLSSKAEGGEKVEALVVTHLLDPIPTEIHAFSAHAMTLPLIVGMADGSVFSLYRENGRIRYRQDK